MERRATEARDLTGDESKMGRANFQSLFLCALFVARARWAAGEQDQTELARAGLCLAPGGDGEDSKGSTNDKNIGCAFVQESPIFC